MWISPAFAASGPAGAGGIMQFLPMIVIFAAFYFILIRPQQKKAKEHRAMLSAIQKGDEVITNGGIAGKLVKVSEQYVTVEIAANTEVVIQRSAIAAKLEKGTIKSVA
ncbi:preprotein translocase subunit YajC [Leeia sp. TBRC 13508]|uniref:Sec translocon accessory complex subunit YajC n=1 Tax=Leeia speluncae TaxID=2884804 RepID=A0ABS8D4W6_9NEIS|nr:preprotein translocase subunit YajC [Leeia speluncae]MCB6183212.1 preprotein translocase subunit YajC [Leeia speluncae]